MDGWPTYVLPDWKQPMPLDGSEALLDDLLTEISGDDLENAWYRQTLNSSKGVVSWTHFTFFTL